MKNKIDLLKRDAMLALKNKADMTLDDTMQNPNNC